MWAKGGRGQGRWGTMAHLGNWAQRFLGHRVHMLSQQTLDGTNTARCRSCRPCTHHGHYRGGWRPQGMLGGRVEEVKWVQGLSAGSPHPHRHRQPSHIIHPPPSQWQPRFFQKQQPLCPNCPRC